MKVIFENDDERVEKFDDILRCALKLVGQDYDGIIANCVFVSGEQIRSINKEQRGVDKVTDVLSFPMLENACNVPINADNFPFDVDMNTGEISLGDIVICKDVAKQQAEEYGHSYERELCYLFTHAVFHLLGFDHQNEEDKAVMRRNEELVLNELNITRDN
ncbi:MAG: rRNA maturation RNase YbeY [Christensenellales bacterium]